MRKDKKARLWKFFLILVFSCLLPHASCLCLLSVAGAEEKSWTGAGDGVDWFDDENWNAESYPTAADDVLINKTDASASISETFLARSITLGGTVPSALRSEEFISGTVAPAAVSDIAVLNRRDGTMALKGSEGTVVLKGTYKDSEENLASQPSLVLYVQ